MKIARIHIEPYEKGFAYGIRKGLYFHVQTTCGLTAISESAPLPNFSEESFEEAFHEAKRLPDLFKEYRLPSKLDIHALPHLLPSNWWAMYCALMDLIDPVTPKPVQTAGYIDSSLVSSEKDFDAVRGLKTIKIKLKPLSFTEAVHFFTTYRDQLLPFKLRLDCNQSWKLSHVIKLVNSFKELDIDFVEEPLLDITNDVELPFRLAADESLRTGPILKNAPVWIIKPMLSPHLISERQMDETIDLIISSSYETKIGINHLNKLCTRLNLTDSCMGLGTLQLFETV